MQFGIFNVGDAAADPHTGKLPSEHERIKQTVAVAKRADELGLDVFAVGEHHNPPFVASSPTSLLSYIAAATDNILLSTSTTLITTNDPVRIPAPGGRPSRPDAWTRQHRPRLPLVRQANPGRRRVGAGELQPAPPLVARGRRGLGGEVPDPAAGVHHPNRGDNLSGLTPYQDSDPTVTARFPSLR